MATAGACGPSIAIPRIGLSARGSKAATTSVLRGDPGRRDAPARTRSAWDAARFDVQPNRNRVDAVNPCT